MENPVNKDNVQHLAPSGVPRVSQGSIVYTGKVRQRADALFQETSLKGNHEYILKVLGIWKRGTELPKLKEVFQLEHSLGWFGGDDIVECLGQESFDKLLAFVEKKYS